MTMQAQHARTLLMNSALTTNPVTTEINARGCTVKRSFVEDGNRYEIDATLTEAGGWAQYDTDSDAWYHGVWVNREARQVLSYVEGDIILVEAPDAESFAAEMQSLADFHGPPPPAFIMISSDGVRTEVFDSEAAHGRLD